MASSRGHESGRGRTSLYRRCHREGSYRENARGRSIAGPSFGRRGTHRSKQEAEPVSSKFESNAATSEALAQQFASLRSLVFGRSPNAVDSAKELQRGVALLTA